MLFRYKSQLVVWHQLTLTDSHLHTSSSVAQLCFYEDLLLFTNLTLWWFKPWEGQADDIIIFVHSNVLKELCDIDYLCLETKHLRYIMAARTNYQKNQR